MVKQIKAVLVLVVLLAVGVFAMEKRDHNHGPEWTDHCWDHAPNHVLDPFCALLTEITCGAIPKVNHATHTVPANTKARANVTYTCVDTYAMSGNDTIICSVVTDENGVKSGVWSSTPTCIKASCDSPPSIDHGRILPFNETIVGQMVRYECFNSYAFTTDFNSVTCQENTTWTAMPICAPKNCSAAPSINNGKPLPYNDTMVGGIIQYVCDTQYTLNSTYNYVVCQNDTTWSTPPSCIEEKCSAAPSIDNGNPMSYNTTVVGAIVQYVCDDQYAFNSTYNYVLCQNDTTWSSPPKCIEEKCSQAPAIDNGKPLDYNETSIGSMVQYLCDEPYIFRSAFNYVVCQNDTMWSTPPTCEKVCSPPPAIQNGKFAPKQGPLFAGTDIVYVCDKQYEIKGSPAITCGKGGHWSPIPTCECIVRPLDVLFIIDDSGSVGIQDFQQMLAFVNDLVDIYANAQTRFALISFSDIVELGFNLDTYENDTVTLKEAIANITYNAGSTDTAAALRYAREHSFNESNGMRLDATQLTILITDGLSNNRTTTIEEATKLKNAGVTLYAVGIGIANYTELKTIASSESYVYGVEGFSSISQISGPLASSICLGGCPAVPFVEHGTALNPLDTDIGNVVKYVCDASYKFESVDFAKCNASNYWSETPVCTHVPTCDEPPAIQHGFYGTPSTYEIGGTVKYTCDTKAAYALVGNETAFCEDNNGTNEWSPIPKCECQRNIDVVFIVDGSGSLGAYGFEDTLDFVNDMISRYSATTTRFGFLVFSSKPILEFYLDEYINDVDALKERVANTSYPTGNTYTYDALAFARTNMFQEINGMRANASQIAIIVTDGISADSNKTIEEAELLRNSGVTVYSIGVGPNADADELTAMASFDKFVFYVEDYSNISRVSGPLAETTCLIDCGPPPAINNGYPITIDNTNMGDTVRYMCNTGYEFESYDDIMCQVSATWTPKPTCTQVICSDPPTIEHGYALNENNTFVGDQVNYTCDADYVFDSNYDVICQPTGNWSVAPICRHAECGPMPVVIHGIISSRTNATTVGTRINYSCERNYRLIGKETVQCDMNEQWSDVPTCVCQDEPRDIVFLVDASGSVGYPNFQSTLKFLQSMTAVYPQAVTRFGLISFSSEPKVEFYLNTYLNDNEGLMEGIANATFSAGGTDTYEAFQLANAELFNVSTGMRENTTHIAVVVTDGQSNNGNLTITEAQNLKDDGVTIYSVGIGDFDTMELDAMASNDSYVFAVQTFSDLMAVAGPLTELTCFGETSDES